MTQLQTSFNPEQQGETWHRYEVYKSLSAYFGCVQSSQTSSSNHVGPVDLSLGVDRQMQTETCPAAGGDGCSSEEGQPFPLSFHYSSVNVTLYHST